MCFHRVNYRSVTDHEQEFVIGGYTRTGSRKYFGALLVGFYEGKKLKFAGRVGTGFSDKLLHSLYFRLVRSALKPVPFSDLPAIGRSGWDRGLTAADMRRCKWVRPVLVLLFLIPLLPIKGTRCSSGGITVHSRVSQPTNEI
jgi:hypothetical protein